MPSSDTIAAALRSALPPELHPHLAGIVQILYAAASGEITPDAADTRLARESAFVPMLRELARSQTTPAHTLVSFGQDTQIGDVGMRDIVGGNLLSFTINNYYRDQSRAMPPADHQAPATPAMSRLILEPDDDEPLAPFVAGPPIMHPQAFFGREAIVRLFQHKPWQKKLKETWESLERGNYDWAHLAYSIWPERVREQCKADKSLAIAHGLEQLYVEPPAKAKKGRGRGKKAQTEDEGMFEGE